VDTQSRLSFRGPLLRDCQTGFGIPNRPELFSEPSGMLRPQDDFNDPDRIHFMRLAGARSINDLFRSIERAGISKTQTPDTMTCHVIHWQCDDPWTVHKARDVAAWLEAPGSIDKLCWELDFATLHAGMQCQRLFPPSHQGSPMIWSVQRVSGRKTCHQHHSDIGNRFSIA